ncbi:hypothetical protein OpiT1DRAFT_00206 [Opitutaceae bacterium TAV1]|nr:hypothetical protein OpiT1DRAFT_00206 [Opitutaceae bacterium TAV1]
MKRILIATTLFFALPAWLAAATTAPLANVRLSGQSEVLAGATLTIASGGTLTVAEGATVNGLATAAQGAKADTAVQKWADLPGVILSGVNTQPLGITLRTSGSPGYDGLLRAPPTASGPLFWYLPAASGTIAITNNIPAPVAARITVQMEPGQTDAELKLPDGDNYASGALILWIHTPDPKGTIIIGQIVPPGTRIYYTDSGRSDSRTHRALDWTTNNGIAYQKSPTGQVGSITFVIPVTATIRPDNPALAWVYHRMTASDHEKDSSGHAIWRIPTVEWITAWPSY